jgi:hypothetical protein
MPRSYWLPVIAVVGLSIISCAQALPVTARQTAQSTSLVNYRVEPPQAAVANAAPASQPQGTKEHPLFVEAITRHGSADQSARAEDERQNKDINLRIARWTKVSAIVAGLMFIAAIAQICLFVWQLRLIRQTLEDAERATKTNAKLSEAAQRTAATAEASLVASTRAWIGVPGMVWGSEPSKDGPMAVQAHIVNYGKEPALEVEVFLVLRSEDYIPEHNIINPNRDHGPNQARTKLSTSGHGFIVYPNGPVQNWYPHEFPNSIINTSAWQAACNKKRSAVIDGCLTYVTCNTRHHTWFRFFLRDTGEPMNKWHFNLCTSGNGAD